MTSTYQLPDGRTLEMVCEPIEVTSNGPRPDPNWTFTDAHGHEHRAVGDGRGRVSWPTLRRAQDDPDEEPFWFDVDGEEHNAPSHWECVDCGEWITPGMRGPSGFREYIPGPVYCTLDGQPISHEDATALVEAARSK